ncbi:type II secretion system minor pseudopilin GspK [Pseudoduganella plicata]|uniref:Type II secretion system protein K n=1 Tax=Pseudoduganella plicata TaxID=321984 RepID=A0A4P7BHT3_9BURK|nr:type II secretion system minor pseudopilin GspK [Pseudoduganella plicata]QBQ37842.1 general secretion pathway protein GspK [Pseudoduganella plicata]GGY93510.1 general secretion pathway protein GspK [Pseudoduganella plicata]
MSAGLHRQRGVAVVTALLLTTLAVTIVASLFWQQQVQVRSMENQRLHLQTRWILRGALDWARLILQQEGNDSRIMTREDGVWATPLAETRLDDYLERERQNNETYDATLSGQIYDAQARYNLANLAGPNGVDPNQVNVFKRLLRNVQMDDALALPVAQAVARARPLSAQGTTGTTGTTGTGGGTGSTGTTGTTTGSTGTTGSATGTGSSAPLQMLRVEDLLTVAGVTQQAVERLRDFVIVLPAEAKVNVNTARAEVLAALFDNMSVSEAQSLVVRRKRSAWPTKDALQADAGAAKLMVDVVVRSDNFLVQSQVRLERAALESWSLIHRELPQGRSITTPVWIREL